MEPKGPDFIVTELLSELKEENKRKEAQINDLHRAIIRVVIAAIAAILLVIGTCFLYLYQYDFSGAEEVTTEKTAEGTFAIIDSDGNAIGYNSNVGVDNNGISENNDNQEDLVK